MSERRQKASDRILAIARTLDPSKSALDTSVIPPEFLHKLKQALLADPLIPRPNPTIALWQEPAHPTLANIQSATLPSLTDFLIIGSGVTGCSVARSLLESNTTNPPHVTLLEARTLVSGATGRNGGHFVTPAGHYYASLARRHGEEAAREITRFSIMNIERIQKLVREMDPKLQQESQLRDVTKVMAAMDAETWRDAKASLAAFQKAVPEHRAYHHIVEESDVPERWNIKGAHGVIEHRAAAVWPYRLITAIFERLLAKYPYSFSLETNTPATAVNYAEPDTANVPGSEYKYAVNTPRGVIYAKQVIHCTNAHAAHLLPKLAGKLHPYRGTMSVQSPGPALENTGNYRSWSGVSKTKLNPHTELYEEGLYYLQQNGITGDIWVGGDTSNFFDILSGDDTYVSPEAKDALVKFLPKYFRDGWPEGTKADLKAIWTGCQGHTSDGLPLVGRLPESLTGRPGTSEWIAAGYSGYGMDKAWMTGEGLVKLIQGESAPGWLPKCFLLTAERLENRLTVEKAIAKWTSVARTGTW